MQLVQPWPEGYSINARSPYGPRRLFGRVKFHHGVDVAMPVGTPLTAPADGTVVHKGSGASGGFVLILRHEGNWHTVYYHLQKPSHRHNGEQVRLGDLIAYSGNTGRSTGPHLHWEVRRSRQWGDTVDPVNFLTRAQTRSQPRTRPSRVGRVSPGLESLSRSWIARGAHFLRGGFGR